MTDEAIVAIVADSGQDLEGYMDAFADLNLRFVYYFNPKEASLNLTPNKFMKWTPLSRPKIALYK